ncbi:AP-2 complex subunit alpha [Smittium culicis]|uniref:AP-2 complex subunit alpha n=1 Tax=Smittium culicis TaxID=133412 RepID=A0A1R1YCH4_9FUNG|nr:AP-2 complex subunit alpha [Smittium culicis]
MNSFEIFRRRKRPAHHFKCYNIRYGLAVEAINLAIHLGNSNGLIQKSLTALESFIVSSDPNARYLGLEALAHLSSKFNDVTFFQKNKSVFYSALNIKDESIQARALDLLFTVCRIENAKEIVEKLLNVLKRTNSNLKSEITTKIALLTEKFATEYTWYVDVMFEIISVEDSSLDNDVWHRVVQVILSHEGLQLYAVRLSLEKIRTKEPSNVGTNVYVFLIGHLGNLISSEPQSSPMDLVSSIEYYLKNGSHEVRSISATAIAKLVSKFPEIRLDSIKILNDSLECPSIEFQQRVREYIAIAELEDPELMKVVFESSFGLNFESALMSKMLSRKDSRLGDRRTWIPGSRLLSGQNSLNSKQFESSPTSNSQNALSINHETSSTANKIANKNSSPTLNGTISSVKNDYDYLLWNSEGTLHEDSEILIKVKLGFKPPLANLTLIIVNKKEFQLNNFSISITDPQDNKSPEDDSGLRLFSSSFEQNVSNLTLIPNVEMDFDYQFVCNEFFEVVPKFNISFSYDTSSESIEKSVLIPVPISFLHFIEQVELNKDDFFSRWKQLQGPPYQSQAVFAPAMNSWTKYKNASLIRAQINDFGKKMKLNSSSSTNSLIDGSRNSTNAADNNTKESIDSLNSDSSFTSSAKPKSPEISVDSALKDLNKVYTKYLFSKLGFYSVPNADSDPYNFVGVGIATTARGGRFGTLIRYEFNDEDKMCQVIVRATNSDISLLLLNEIKRLLTL